MFVPYLVVYRLPASESGSLSLFSSDPPLWQVSISVHSNPQYIDFGSPSLAVGNRLPRVPLQQNRDPPARPGPTTLAYADIFSDLSDGSDNPDDSEDYSETRGSPAPSHTRHPSLDSFHSIPVSAIGNPEMDTDQPSAVDRIGQLERLVTDLTATVNTLSTRLAAAEAKVRTLESEKTTPAVSAPASVSASQP